MSGEADRRSRLLQVALLSFALLLAGPVAAADMSSVEAQHDKTGDAIVDAADWKQMNDKEKAAYARDSMLALGQNPDMRLNNGKTLTDQYMDSLNSIYGTSE